MAVGAEPRVPVLGPEDLAGGLSALHVANFAILDGALVDGLFTFSLHQGSFSNPLFIKSDWRIGETDKWQMYFISQRDMFVPESLVY